MVPAHPRGPHPLQVSPPGAWHGGTAQLLPGGPSSLIVRARIRMGEAASSLAVRVRRGRAGAGGAPGTVRGGRLSKSVAKALCDRIDREQNRGISTILLARPGPMGAFATDLDKQRRRGPAGTFARGRRGPAGDRDGRCGERTGPAGRGAGLPGRPPTPRRALRTRKCSSNRHSRRQNAPLECKMHISTGKGPERAGV